MTEKKSKIFMKRKNERKCQEYVILTIEELVDLMNFLILEENKQHNSAEVLKKMQIARDRFVNVFHFLWSE